MNCQIAVTDFTEQHTAIYVKVEVYDPYTNQRYQEELRFLGDLLYGDFVHEKRSPLTESCRLEVIAYLKAYFER